MAQRKGNIARVMVADGDSILVFQVPFHSRALDLMVQMCELLGLDHAVVEPPLVDAADDPQ